MDKSGLRSVQTYPWNKNNLLEPVPVCSDAETNITRRGSVNPAMVPDKHGYYYLMSFIAAKCCPFSVDRRWPRRAGRGWSQHFGLHLSGASSRAAGCG